MATLPSQQLQHLRVEFSKPRLFGRSDIGERGLIRGWAAPEDGHTWNDGLEAVLSLEVAQQAVRASVLDIDGIPYIFGDAAKQEITLYANASYLGFWRFTERRLAKMVARVEPEQWVIRRGVACLSLTWLIPGSMRPREIGDGTDGRCLGFAFRSLLVTDVKGD